MKGMPYKGHDERDESPYSGKWKQFIQLSHADQQPNVQAADKVKQQYPTYDYTLKRSTIKLTNAMKTEVRQQIKDEI